MSVTLYKTNMKYSLAHYGTILGILLILLGIYSIQSCNRYILCIITPLFTGLMVYCIYTSYCLTTDSDAGCDSNSDSDSISDKESVSSDPSMDSDSDNKDEMKNDFKHPTVSQNLSMSDYYKKFK